MKYYPNPNPRQDWARQTGSGSARQDSLMSEPWKQNQNQIRLNYRDPYPTHCLSELRTARSPWQDNRRCYQTKKKQTKVTEPWHIKYQQVKFYSCICHKLSCAFHVTEYLLTSQHSVLFQWCSMCRKVQMCKSSSRGPVWLNRNPWNWFHENDLLMVLRSCCDDFVMVSDREVCFCEPQASAITGSVELEGKTDAHGDQNMQLSYKVIKYI